VEISYSGLGWETIDLTMKLVVLLVSVLY